MKKRDFKYSSKAKFCLFIHFRPQHA